MHERMYSEALREALRGGVSVERALSRLRAVLQKNGHERLYANVLARTETALLKEEREGVTRVAVAKRGDERRYAKEIARLAGAGERDVRIDPSIIGGYIARGKEREIDASYKRSLLEVYRSLIAT